MVWDNEWWNGALHRQMNFFVSLLILIEIADKNEEDVLFVLYFVLFRQMLD